MSKIDNETFKDYAKSLVCNMSDAESKQFFSLFDELRKTFGGPLL